MKKIILFAVIACSLVFAGCSVVEEDVDVPEENADQVVEFTIYQNEEIGFEFQYPAQLVIKGNAVFWKEEMLDLEKVDTIAYPEFVFKISEEGQTMHDFILEHMNPTQHEMYEADTAKIQKVTIIGENEFVELQNLDYGSGDLFISKDGRTLGFFAVNKPALREVLKTLKFTSSN